MNKALGDKVRKWLQEPLPIHRHSPNPEACLTPLAQADVERMHTVTLGYIQQLESTVSQVSKALCGKENATLDKLLQTVDQLKSRLAKVERERVELLKDFKLCVSKSQKACKVRKRVEVE